MSLNASGGSLAQACHRHVVPVAFLSLTYPSSGKQKSDTTNERRPPKN